MIVLPCHSHASDIVYRVLPNVYVTRHASFASGTLACNLKSHTGAALCHHVHQDILEIQNLVVRLPQEFINSTMFVLTSLAQCGLMNTAVFKDRWRGFTVISLVLAEDRYMSQICIRLPA